MHLFSLRKKLGLLFEIRTFRSNLALFVTLQMLCTRGEVFFKKTTEKSLKKGHLDFKKFSFEVIHEPRGQNFGYF